MALRISATRLPSASLWLIPPPLFPNPRECSARGRAGRIGRSLMRHEEALVIPIIEADAAVVYTARQGTGCV